MDDNAWCLRCYISLACYTFWLWLQRCRALWQYCFIFDEILLMLFYWRTKPDMSTFSLIYRLLRPPVSDFQAFSNICSLSESDIALPKVAPNARNFIDWEHDFSKNILLSFEMLFLMTLRDGLQGMQQRKWAAFWYRQWEKLFEAYDEASITLEMAGRWAFIDISLIFSFDKYFISGADDQASRRGWLFHGLAIKS